LTVFGELGHKRGIESALEGFARLAFDQSLPARALTLAAAATALRRTTGAVVRWGQERTLERIRDLASGQCDPAFANERWTAGSRMSLDEATAYALTTADQATLPP
jgi:hypothetical protein